MNEQQKHEQEIRLAIVQDLMRVHQLVDTDIIIKQAQALSDFVLGGVDKVTQSGQTEQHEPLTDQAKTLTNDEVLACLVGVHLVGNVLCDIKGCPIGYIHLNNQ